MSKAVFVLIGDEDVYLQRPDSTTLPVNINPKYIISVRWREPRDKSKGSMVIYQSGMSSSHVYDLRPPEEVLRMIKMVQS